MKFDEIGLDEEWSKLDASIENLSYGPTLAPLQETTLNRLREQRTHIEFVQRMIGQYKDSYNWLINNATEYLEEYE